MAQSTRRRSSLHRLILVLSISALLIIAGTAQPASEDGGGAVASAGADPQSNVTAPADGNGDAPAVDEPSSELLPHPDLLTDLHVGGSAAVRQPPVVQPSVASPHV